MENNIFEKEIREVDYVNNDMIENNENETVDADDIIVVKPVEPEEEKFNFGPLILAGALAGLGIALARLAHRKSKKPEEEKTEDEIYEELKQEMMREAAKRGETVTFEKVEDDSDADSEEVESDEDDED